MIAIESFKKFRLSDILAIVILAIIWFGLSLLISTFFGPQASYIISFLIAVTLMSFAVHMVRKAGSATIFYTFGALLASSIMDIGPTGTDKVIVFFIAGLIFELVFIVLKLEIENIQLDIVAATIVSSASIPFLTAYLLSPEVASIMMAPLINVALLSALIGFCGAMLSFIAWRILRVRTFFVRFEYLRH